MQITTSATVNRKTLLSMAGKNGCCCYCSYHRFCYTLDPFCSLCCSSSSVIMIVIGRENKQRMEMGQARGKNSFSILLSTGTITTKVIFFNHRYSSSSSNNNNNNRSFFSSEINGYSGKHPIRQFRCMYANLELLN